jgi:hypothetical protein
MRFLLRRYRKAVPRASWRTVIDLPYEKANLTECEVLISAGIHAVGMETSDGLQELRARPVSAQVPAPTARNPLPDGRSPHPE